MEIFDTEAGRSTNTASRQTRSSTILRLSATRAITFPAFVALAKKPPRRLSRNSDRSKDSTSTSTRLIRKAIKDKLTNEKNNAFLSYELATIDTNVKLDIKIEDLAYGVLPDFDTLENLTLDLGFKSLANRVLKEKESALKSESFEALELALAPEETAPEERTEEEELESFDFTEGQSDGIGDIHSTPHAYVMIRTIDGVRELANVLAKTKEICIDTETTGHDANTAEIIGISFAIKPFEAILYPHSPARYWYRHRCQYLCSQKKRPLENALTMGLELNEVLEILRPVSGKSKDP